ncbi:hypothetical protein GOP47_0010821 [Adiantum capillus-veneris]|uniref:Purple acid phosphatase n=1 Tax=Adiantum capillus-veneris TaxID=13818 RepID=A0A9D4ZJ59_ADICA|nr:hypothetical protein GOP47_0010821 [Adiantum capillus-veneris]
MLQRCLSVQVWAVFLIVIAVVVAHYMSSANSKRVVEENWESCKEACTALAKAGSSYVHPRDHKDPIPGPQQVHVSLAGPYQMKVSWVTSGSTGISRVDYGRTPGLYDRYAEGTSESYSFLLYKSGQVHNVLLGPLEASTLYYYKCGGGGPEYSFKTPPPVGAEIPITFAIAGDLGQTEWTSATLNHIQQADYDVLILPGDLSYADYYQPLWDSFGQLVEPLASSRPWMVTQGNHEIERIPLLIDPFRAYNMRWSMPYKESGSDSNLYYSFEVSGSHILMLGSYAKFDRGSNQYKWLLADLAKVNRTATPWLIAVIHAPWYSSNSKHQGDGEQMRKSMELILKEANVDLVFAGHVHAYERTAKIFDWKADDCGVYHMTIGDGGNREGLAREFMDPKPAWSLFREASFGYGILQILNSTHAHWIWHRNQDNSSAVGDDLWLTKTSKSSSLCGATITG